MKDSKVLAQLVLILYFLVFLAVSLAVLTLK